MQTFLEKSNGKIKKAGIELETKGITIKASKLKDGKIANSHNPDDYTLSDIPKHTVILNNPRIEVDTGNLEYVSVPHQSPDELFSNLANAQRSLLSILASAPVADNEINLYDEKYALYRNTAYPLYLAHPQITFEIKKGKLNSFIDSFKGNRIRYRKGRDATGELFEQYDGYQLNENVASQLVSWFEIIDKDKFSSANVKALAKMVFMAHASAYLQQDEVPYYKAHFSVLPRTSFHDLYTSLTADEKLEYEHTIEIIDNRLPFVGIKPFCLTEMPVSFSSALLSTYKPFTSYKKTMPGMPDKEVELLASDRMASTGDVGASFGMLALPEDSDGVYEMRKLPYANIDRLAEIIGVYQDCINHYSR